MKNLNVAIFEKNLYRAYKGGEEFDKAIKRSGASKIYKIYFAKLVEENGVLQAIKLIKNQLSTLKVDVIFFSLDNCFELPPRFFQEIRNEYTLIIYVGDDEHYFDRSARYYAQSFDLVLSSSPLCAKRHELYGVNALYFPASYNTSHYQSIESTSCEDVTFIGKVSGKLGREDYINSLKDNKDIDFANYGIGSTKGILTLSQMYSIYKSSKISLNFTGVSNSTILDYDITINRRIHGLKGRCQEIAMCGGFVLTEYAPGIEELFTLGSEIDTFKSLEELTEKVNFYLRNDDIRNAMAERANVRALKYFSDVYQWRRIGEIIQEEINPNKDKSKNSLYLDPIFLKSYASFHYSKYIISILKFNLYPWLRDIPHFLLLGIPDIKLLAYYLKREIYLLFKHGNVVLRFIYSMCRKYLKR